MQLLFIKKIRLHLRIAFGAMFFLVISASLFFLVRSNYLKQKDLLLNAYTDLEMQIVRQCARSSGLILQTRRNEGFSVDKIEQEIFTSIIDPVRILKSGDGWIYNKSHVIYDKSADFPDIYKGKSIGQIFEIQKKKGADHYQALVFDVENAREGRGWYLWLPEKGREWGAWTSFKAGNSTWTVGLSTPENEIFQYYNLDGYLLSQSVFASVIAVLFLAAFIIFARAHIIESKRSALLANLVDDLNKTNEKLYKLDAIKNDFIANITHDFRSPLTAILGITEMNLKKAPPSWEDTKESFQIIFSASFKLLASIDRLLEIAKMDAGGLKLSVKKEDIIAFVSSVISYHTALVRNSGITIAGVMPDHEIDDFYTDRNKLEEILNNLLSNAEKFVDKNSGQITVTCRDLADFIEISIADNGIGIDRTDIDRIFNRFEQGASGRSVYRRGTGIGLSFSKQLVEALYGTIRVESDGHGKGSRFSIILPKGKKHFKPEELV
jgi:signal transduction histidine kinase